MTNPLLNDWSTPFGLPPFDAISDDDFAPAVDAALAEARANYAAIVSEPEITCAKTVEAMERTTATLDRVMGAFYALAGADANPAREALMREFAPKMSAFWSEVTTNEALFARVETLWEQRDDLGLNDEQARLLYLSYRGFVRAGSKLKGAEADRLTEVKSRLSVLGTQFTQNLLADERSWFMPLAETDLNGLPDYVVSALRAAGKDKDQNGPVVTLSRSVIVPFLQTCPNRDLRRKSYEAWTARGANGGETDNRAIAAEILALRSERAQLLGYEDFAHYKLETEMAGTPDAVRGLLMDVWGPAKSRAEADAKILENMLHNDGHQGPLEAWDWHYYSAIRRKAEHDLDEAEVKPYFQLDRMIDAAFACANRLFGLEFKPTEGPQYHPDVRLF